VRARGDRKCKTPQATYAVAGFCARYANEPAENCCAQLTEQTRSSEYKSSDQRDHERKQHKVTQEHEHTYALFFISQSCPPKDLPSARFATLEPQKLFRRMSSGNGCLKKAPHRTRWQSAALVSWSSAPYPPLARCRLTSPDPSLHQAGIIPHKCQRAALE
jgi:hypothetical protein